MHRIIPAVAVALLLTALPLTAMALDVQVSSTTSTQVYEVYGGNPGLFLTRRRVTERLTLHLARLLPREAEPGYGGPRISASFSLRIDADFGHRSAETRLTSELWFIPGYDPYAVDILVGEVRVRDLFRRTTDLRAGRIISFDPTGFFALDGVEVAVRTPWHLRLWFQTGADVVAGQRLSSGTFEVDGIARQRRDDFASDQFLEIEDTPTRVVIAAGASLMDLDWLSADISFRQGIEPSDDSSTSYQRLAGVVSFNTGRFRGGLQAGGDFALGMLDRLAIELGVRPTSWLRVSLLGQYDAPVFDVHSIFAAFWSEPSIDGELRLEFRPFQRFVVGLSGIVRQTGVQLRGGNISDVDGLRYGGSLYSRLRWRWLMAELRGRVGLGFGGQRIGAIARVLASIPRNPLSFDFRGIIFSTREDLEPEEAIISYGYVVGARYELSDDASILFELEHNASEELGQQFRFLAMLDLGVWI